MVPEISAKMLYHRPQKAEKHVVTVAVDQTRGSEGREGGTEGTEPWYRAGRESAVSRSEWPRQRTSSTDLDGKGSSRALCRQRTLPAEK